MKTFLIAAATLAAVTALGQGDQFQSFTGRKVPDFVMTTTNGKKLSRAKLQGKVVLVDFWATWCGPCKMASPAIERLYKTFGKRGLVVIGADVGEQQPGPDGAKAYKKEHGYTYTFTYENDGLERTLGIQGIPAFMVLDKKGVIKVAEMGLPRAGGADALYNTLASQIKPLLASR